MPILNPSLRGDQPFSGWTTWQSLIHPLCHSEERLVRRENLILSDSTIPQCLKMRSSRPQKTRAQDDGCGVG
jgi:hypothetical protein